MLRNIYPKRLIKLLTIYLLVYLISSYIGFYMLSNGNNCYLEAKTEPFTVINKDGLDPYQLFYNNIKVGLLGFLGGIVSLGIFAAFSTVFNGLLIGIAIRDITQAGMPWFQVLSLSYHVPFEVLSLILFAAIGTTSNYFFNPKIELGEKLFFYGWHLCVCALMLAISAYLESLLSH